jgi:putative phosphoribosyl transferase
MPFSAPAVVLDGRNLEPDRFVAFSRGVRGLAVMIGSFRDRAEAGRMLASRLAAYARVPGVVVLGLPRGGVPVAYEVAHALDAPLDVFLVRKLGVPGHEELAMGAIASGGVRVFNDEVVSGLRISGTEIERVAKREQAELERREALYRNGRPAPDLHGKTVILVDDGLATGSTMRAAIEGVRRHAPARIIVAVPVGAASTCEELRAQADEVVCVLEPERFYAVGMWYQDFTQASDEEIRSLLERARPRSSAGRNW